MKSKRTNIEKKLIISLLKLTDHQGVPFKIVAKDSKIPLNFAHFLIQKWDKKGLVRLDNKNVAVERWDRIKLAIYALKMGADLKEVSRFLDWKEFENMTAIAFKRNGYRVKRNFWFTTPERKWEIDVIGCKKPAVLCVDCKHWQRGLTPSSLRKIVEDQIERTQVLSESLSSSTEDIGCSQWKTIKLIPAILSLTRPRFRFYQSVPVIGILQLQDFINQFPAYVRSLKHFTI